MTRRSQMIECMEEMQLGMEKTTIQRDIWQSNLIWWMCKAIYLLLENAVRKKED